jgi:hypothetical protein
LTSPRLPATAIGLLDFCPDFIGMEVLPKFWPGDCDHPVSVTAWGKPSTSKASVMSPASGLWLALTITQNVAVFGGGEIPWPDPRARGIVRAS